MKQAMQSLEAIVRANLARAREEITRSVQLAQAGIPLAAETEPHRAAERIERKMSLGGGQAETIASSIRQAGEMMLRETPLAGAEKLALAPMTGPEKIIGPTLDFVNVSFLARGARVARAVARIATFDGQPQGSGFLIGDGLFMTNAHVIPTIAEAQGFVLQFDFELGLGGAPLPTTRFRIDPSVFITDPVDGLDFTIVAVGERIDGPANLADYGLCGLSDAGNKHMLGEAVNIVQHPQGRFKEVVLRENRLVARLEDVLHYVADTEPGSSGSPVFNNAWEVIALHHWGGPSREWIDETGQPVPHEVNEGIRISAIVRKLREVLPGLPPATRNRIERALQMGAESHAFAPAGQDLPQASEPPPRGPSVRTDADGRATWTIPIEISVALPQLSQGPAAAPAVAAAAAATPAPSPSPSPSALLPAPASAEKAPSPDYAARRGYDPDFLDGFTIPLPTLTSAKKKQVAISRQPAPGMPEYALPYHHFTVVVNKARKLAFYTACNIDGASAKSINRKTKRLEPLRPDSPGLESIDGAEGMEGAETWYDDPRIDPGDIAGKAFYDGQVLPDFAPRSQQRTLNMFQRGHLVRRLDPCWGDDTRALEAEVDTFHFTNCTPQVGFFNQGRAPADTPDSERGSLWRSVENWVLRNAVASEARVTCFTGPIFAESDKPYRGILIPERFFKVAVWVDNGALKAMGMIASQARLLGARRESLAEGTLTFASADELAKIDDFQVAIEEIERLTGIRFGAAVRGADIFAPA